MEKKVYKLEGSPHQSPNLLVLWSQISNFQNCDKWGSVVNKPSSPQCSDTVAYTDSDVPLRHKCFFTPMSGTSMLFLVAPVLLWCLTNQGHSTGPVSRRVGVSGASGLPHSSGRKQNCQFSHSRCLNLQVLEDQFFYFLLGKANHKTSLDQRRVNVDQW